MDEEGAPAPLATDEVLRDRAVVGDLVVPAEIARRRAAGRLLQPRAESVGAQRFAILLSKEEAERAAPLLRHATRIGKDRLLREGLVGRVAEAGKQLLERLAEHAPPVRTFDAAPRLSKKKD
jgi:hypothetical protein